MTTTQESIRRLNHVEMLYRPGERALAGRVFELLGMRVLDRGTEWLYALADPAVADVSNNAIYASEVTSEQSMLEDALVAVIDGAATDGAHNERGLGATARCYLERLRADPQRSFHFGIRYHHRDDFDATLDRIRSASTDADLAGRVELRGVFLPDEPGALAPNMIQAFVRTDVVAAGLLAFGQHIELQWHLSDRRED